jgi:hypothetical protein
LNLGSLNFLRFSVHPFVYGLQTSSTMQYDFFVLDSNEGNPILLLSASGDIASVPEPSSLSLIAIGLLGLAGYRWQQRRREGLQIG